MYWYNEVQSISNNQGGIMNPIVMLSLNVLAMYFVFWTIKPINFAKFMPYTPKQAAFLKIILAVGLGYLVASFFISITNWVLAIPGTVFGK